MTDEAAAAPLVVGVPSKGRLQENAAAFFARAGLPLRQERGARDYRGLMDGVDAEVKFLSAGEIAAGLASGTLHLGVTGEDLIRETIPDADDRVILLAPLGFGGANVVVAVPKAWIDVRVMDDLEDVAAAFHARHGHRLRVATKYVNLTRRHFASHHVTDYRIVESLGATEGAPAAGTAEVVVDITTSGATLEANALKVLDDGVILRSEANLAASRGALWSPRARAAARILLGRIAAEEAARTTREVAVGGAPEGFAEAVAAAAGIVRSGGGADPAVARLPAAAALDFADRMLAAGAHDVAISTLAYAFSARNPLLDRFEAGIG